jgi:CubicO group peptidase (beta-lactamase class C family)
MRQLQQQWKFEMADLLNWYVKGLATPWKVIKYGIELPFNLLSKDIQLPENLSDVTTFEPADEVSPLSVGMTTKGVAAIWSAVEDLYRTGLYPAISFCLRRHGNIVLKRAIGHRKGNGPDDDDESAELIKPDTPVCIFSCTKAVTAMLVHLLSERRALSLLDPISYYIPEFSQKGKNNITIFQLLCHQAGISKISSLDEEEFIEIIFHPKEVVRRICAARADHPGYHTGYHAVTAGFVIGEIVQRVTGQDCRQFLAENIQEPLKLNYFNYGLKPDEIEKAALNYSTGLPSIYPFTLCEKRLLGFPLDKTIRISNERRFQEMILPAGNIYATADECTQFFQMMLDGGSAGDTQIFKPLTIRRATQGLGKVEIDRNLFVPIRYSAGMMLGDRPFGVYGPDTSQAFGHLGATNNFCWADPERNISVAILTTGKPMMGRHVFSIARLLARISRQCSPLSKLEQHTIARAKGMVCSVDRRWPM